MDNRPWQTVSPTLHNTAYLPYGLTASKGGTAHPILHNHQIGSNLHF